MKNTMKKLYLQIRSLQQLLMVIEGPDILNLKRVVRSNKFKLEIGEERISKFINNHQIAQFKVKVEMFQICKEPRLIIRLFKLLLKLIIVLILIKLKNQHKKRKKKVNKQ